MAAVRAEWRPLVTADDAIVVAADVAVAAHPTLVVVVTLVTDVGSPLSIDAVTAVVVVFLLIRRRVRAVLYVAGVRVLELASETLLKVTVDRPRPSVPTVPATPQGMSFPSGRTAGTAAPCTSLLLLSGPWLAVCGRGRVAAAAGLAVVAVAGSRVLLGVHYLSDVLGGAILGALCALVLGLFATGRFDRDEPNVGDAPERQS